MLSYVIVLSYCLKCKIYIENINPKLWTNINGRKISLSKCALCNSNISGFINEQEASGLLNN